MKTTLNTCILALALLPATTNADVLNGTNNNEIFIQVNPSELGNVPAELQPFSTDQSVLGDTFNFLGGNDRLFLLRDDDLAGLTGVSNGVVNMGDGRDVVITSFNMSGTFNLGTGNDFFQSGGSGFNHGILVLAGPGNDLIDVTTDNSQYGGEDGNDIFVSDGADNVFDGGNGSDTYSAERATRGASIDLAAGTAFARFNLESDQLIRIENLRGSSFDDRIFGDLNNNRIDGLEGNDNIDGDPGDDTIAGGLGVNTLIGGDGTDTLVVQGVVTTKERLDANTIHVVGSLNGVSFDHTATGFEQVLDNGTLKSISHFMNPVIANTGTNSLAVIAESPVSAAILGFSNGVTLNGTAAANILIGGDGSDDIAGFAGNDTLNGKAGDDFLAGGDGNDTLNGGAGLDTLTGGSGSDFFVFNSAFAGGADRITDYNIAQDTIRIKRSLVGNLPAGALAAIRFKVLTGRAILDADDRIVYNPTIGSLMFDSNGAQAGGAALIATLPVNLAVTAAEIVIIP